jgi:hypothetical protein
MSLLSSVDSELDPTIRPGTPPMLHPPAVEDPVGWAARHREALRRIVLEAKTGLAELLASSPVAN